MVLINLCMQMECLVSQNYTTGIDVERPPKLFDTRWWMRYGSELWEKLSPVASCDGFYFHCKNKRSGFLLSSFNVSQFSSGREWKMTQTVLTFSEKPKPQPNPGDCGGFVVMDAKSVQGITFVKQRTLKVISIITEMINSIWDQCWKTDSDFIIV